MTDPNQFYGPNLGYILELYERFRQDPNSLDHSTREFFANWQPPVKDGSLLESISARDTNADHAVRVNNLANAIRTYGYLGAHLDALGNPPTGDPWLEFSFHHLSKAELEELPATLIAGAASQGVSNAMQAINNLIEIYCGSIGYDYGHIRNPQERDWLRESCESGIYRHPQLEIDLISLLERLTQVETLEHFLHRTFPGKTRFSIEGLDMMVPMIDEILRSAVAEEICMVKLGMAHRGRLNILAHNLHKPYAQILAEFQDPSTNFTTRNELGWTGDVKYHTGRKASLDDEDSVRLVISMPPNPSHLEHINPVVIGMARAAGSVTDQAGAPQLFPDACLPILIHGDASFPAQGIVAENLNISRLEGYTVGGTLHIVANNQLGFTTSPDEGRSSMHASDLAKGFGIPIIHVNADDPLACIEAARTAFAYRQKFRKDFLINLIGYRRYGHNEGDEPSFTQPIMYARIKNHPSIRSLLAERLVSAGVVSDERAHEMVRTRMNHLHEILESLEPEREIQTPQLEPPPPGKARRVKTAVPLQDLKEINQAMLNVPEDFNLHAKLERAMVNQRDMFSDDDEPSVGWAAAEQLAFASILTEGISIRLTGQDTGRGTFSQRHAYFIDVKDGKKWTPLNNLPQAKASFEVINSPLSENAALAFEFGYNLQSPHTLVVWEAQYGDFINSAQVIIDEFVTSGRAKWELTPSLVLLLPHGYEGQGPDHSSARLERFLQLAAQTNIRVANCTTAAQYFHLLRRQAALLESDPLPLVVLTPKSLLRHPLVMSPPHDFARGTWQPVLDDPRARQDPDKIRRIILCSGKIFIDLVTSQMRDEDEVSAIIRIEQLYRFPFDEIAEAIDNYQQVEEIVWVQEEPMNMGAWSFLRPCLEQIIQDRLPIEFVGRVENASPAEGSASWHKVNQEAIIKKAFGYKIEEPAKVGLVEKD
jgi:2-oxoglutarate dehydrogenase E1 component